MIQRSQIGVVFRRTVALAFFAGTALALSGCKVGPNYEGPPAVDSPGAFGAVPPAGTPDVKSLPAPGDVQLAAWWKQLGDPTLDSLVNRSLAGNLDLKLAQSRVKEARAARGIVVADWFPAVDAAGAYSRSRASSNTVGNTGGLGVFQPSEGTDLYTAGFDAAWEIDFWGRTARGVEAADATIQQTIENRRDVMVQLLAEVGRNYVELRGQQERLDVTARAVRVQEDSLKLTESRFQAGLVGELDVAQAKAQLENRRAQIFPIKTAIERSINRLSVLLGRPPRTLAEELSPTKPLPGAPSIVNVGLPSELLKRRPDIRAAERALGASTARIGVATADLYPSFSITAALGFSSNQFGSWFDMSSRFWSITPGVRWPVLDWGRIKSNIQVQDARTEQAMIQYEQVVLGSFEDVESSLLQMVSEQQRYSALVRAVDASKRAVALAEDLYQTGNVDFRTVLDNQLILYNAEDQAVISHSLALTSMIALYKSLGGGWEDLENDAWKPSLTPSSTISAVVEGQPGVEHKPNPDPAPYADPGKAPSEVSSPHTALPEDAQQPPPGAPSTAPKPDPAAPR